MSSYLDKVKKDMEEIAGQWNGDESGAEEERADAAKEVIQNIDRIEQLFTELDY